ncbi:MAG: oligopeptidase B, partial [Blastocatellia bacterium]
MNAQEQPPTPPTAKKIPKTTQIHGYSVTDDYGWLRDDKRESADVVNYLKAENDYADAMTRSQQGFREALYTEMLGRIKEDDAQVPYKQGDYYYYSRTEKGKQYAIRCRKKGSLTAPEEITIDENQMAEGKQFFSLGSYNVSTDGNLLAFSTD